VKKHAFSLIELIFVIVLIGVLSGVGFYMSQPDATKQDAQYTMLKLKEARYHAIGYNTGNGTPINNGCVTLTKDALSNASDNNDSMHREIKSTIPLITDLSAEQTVCFDSLGRSHNGTDITLSSLLSTNIDIFFKDGDKNATIRLLNGTGYVIIQCKN
jgi:prepilin-type N-terminal cleavage/methylation domain-containing protein